MKKYNVFTDGKKNFNYLDSSIGEFIYIVLQYLVIAFLYIGIALGLKRGSILNEVASAVVEIAFAATVLIVARATKTSIFHATKLNVKPKGYQIGFTFLLALIAYFGFSSLTNSFIELLDVIGYKSSSSGISISAGWKYPVYILTMAVLPAFCEELLFRGLVYNGLRTWSKMGAVFVSAALFMLMHGSPDQTIHQFLLGIVLALLFEATGRSWCPMLLHFLNNFIALTLAFIYSNMVTTETEVSSVSESVSASPAISFIIGLIVAIFATAIAGLLVWLIVRYLIKRKNKEDGVSEPVEAVTENGETVIDVPAKEVETNAAESKPESKINDNQVSDKGRIVAIVFFTLASVWVAIEWIQALIVGIVK